MNIEEIRQYCLSKQAVTESLPFSKNTLVFKVGAKMFALIALEKLPIQINLKCDPDRAIRLREAYEVITPGYHMNKKHWNTVTINGRLSPDFIKELIDHSYDLVIQSMTKKERKSLVLN